MPLGFFDNDFINPFDRDVNPSSWFTDEFIAAGGSELSVSLLTNTGAVFSPSLEVQAVTLTAGAITNSSSLFTPLITPGSIVVITELIGNTNQTYEFALIQQQNLSASFIDSTGNLYVPTLVSVEIEKRGGGVKKKAFPKPRNRDEEVLLLIKVFLLCHS